MNSMKIRAGGRLNFEVHRGDSEAVSATFIMQNQEEPGTVVTATEMYDDDGVAFFDIGSPDTDVVGVYDYQINENFIVGSPDMYPDPTGCEGDCEFPTVTICESLPEGS